MTGKLTECLTGAQWWLNEPLKLYQYHFIDMFDEGFLKRHYPFYIYLPSVIKYMRIRKSLKQSQETKQQPTLGMT